MSKIKYYVLVSFFVFIACKKEQKVAMNYQLKIPFIKDKTYLISKLIDTCYYVPLETAPSNLLDVIKKVVIKGKQVFVSDDTSINCYDLKGGFVNRISKMGRGPNEYVTLQDFVIDETYIYIYDVSGRKIFLYDKNTGLYKNSIVIPFFADEIEKIGDEIIFHAGQKRNTSNYDYEIISFNIKTKKIRKFFKNSEKHAKGSKLNHLTKNGERIIYTPKQRNTAYAFTKGLQVEGYTLFNFYKDKEQVDISESSSKYSEKFSLFSDFLETKSYVFFEFNDENRINRVVYDKKNNVSMESIKNDIGLFSLGTPKTIYNDYFVATVDSHLLSMIKNIQQDNLISKNLREQINNILISDNSTLFFYKFKN
ncbi:6-bladed beta-propeller [Flavivirga aquimarina]|uniref:6-bladed beta-propeller n=1 Tax=Flavivirga aquimarina TaxID=2027862 RepID=A0ABT8WC85_9FLAO|nr:6-bladed beta-propeller [Flavivirga aquimarina]MDO5970757.1 6-bladed beta-propeller [Flavivirga aquimarina]